MKRAVIGAVVIALVIGGAGFAVAFPPGHPGGGPMMWGARGAGMWGGGPGMAGRAGGCMGAAATSEAEAITPDRAKEIASAFVAEHFKGFTIERVIPFTMRAGTMYQVELKGPQGESRTIHVNPWGQVRPFGPMAQAR